jgi:hypothetical protein
MMEPLKLFGHPERFVGILRANVLKSKADMVVVGERLKGGGLGVETGKRGCDLTLRKFVILGRSGRTSTSKDFERL